MVACLHSVALLTLSWASSHRGPSPLSHSRVAQARPSSAFASAALSPPRSVSLDAWLEGFQNQTLASAVRSIFTSTRIIAHKIRTASCDSQCCFNTLDGGDDEEAIDLLANQVRVRACNQPSISALLTRGCPSRASRTRAGDVR